VRTVVRRSDEPNRRPTGRLHVSQPCGDGFARAEGCGARSRHCSVRSTLPGADPPALEWQQAADRGWACRVAYAIRDGDQVVLVEAWVPARHLQPADGKNNCPRPVGRPAAGGGRWPVPYGDRARAWPRGRPARGTAGVSRPTAPPRSSEGTPACRNSCSLVCDLHDTLPRPRPAGPGRQGVAEPALCAEHLDELRSLVHGPRPDGRGNRDRLRGSTPNRRGRRLASIEWAAKGRHSTGSRSAVRPAADAGPTAQQKAAVRAWARAYGVAVSARGRLSPQVVRQYQEA